MYSVCSLNGIEFFLRPTITWDQQTLELLKNYIWPANSDVALPQSVCRVPGLQWFPPLKTKPASPTVRFCVQRLHLNKHSRYNRRSAHPVLLMPKNPHAPSAFSAKSFCKGKFPHFALRENLYSRICNSASDVTKFHIVQYMWVIRTVNKVALACYIKFWNLGMFLYWSPLFFSLCLSSRTRKSRKWPEKSRSRLRSLMQHRYDEQKRIVKHFDCSRSRKTFGHFVSFGLANLTKRLAILGRKAISSNSPL